MRNAVRRFVLAAGVLAITGAAAYAQGSLYAKIPFEFRATGKLLPAGRYSITHISPPIGVRVLLMAKEGSGESVLLVQRYAVDTSQLRNPELWFGCIEGKCSLQKVFVGGYGGWAVGTPSKHGAHELQASVRLERAPTD